MTTYLGSHAHTSGTGCLSRTGLHSVGARRYGLPLSNGRVLDCAIAVMAFMLRIARGDGLPVQGTAQGTGPSVPPSYTSAQLANMRVYIFESLFYERLDLPTELGVLASDLSELRAE